MRITEICLAIGLGGLELYFEKCSKWFHNSSHFAISIALQVSRLEKQLK